ncbi:acetylcholine receptor subunit alpha-type acr-16-like [Ctenocephalides felis]|uniref:acetylcholine receptor subunit alpha-type acr-16-like n=1 Tax=Ctenocephalides felis TaxID=7515 RepID=UPI000E6E115D|nr:acetylcholine receptor subunit alpha-type acr-16-like [Ctenocephalides felis]
MILRYILLLFVCLFIREVRNADTDDASKSAQNLTWSDKIKKSLLADYDKFTRPAERDNTTTVQVGLVITHVDLDEQTAVMTVNGWTKMTWKDPKLVWDPEQFNGVKTIHLADHEIWQPDILLYNSATGSSIDHYGNTLAIVFNGGDVLWVPPSTFSAFCELDLTYWPYDTQHCRIKLGSWTYDANQLDIVLSTPDTTDFTELLISNNEWQVKDYTAERHQKYYPCCPEPYADVEFNITLTRRSPTYSSLVITPASIVVLMTLLSFWLPPTAGEKIILNSCNAIIICILMMYFSQKLPVMANHTPLVVLFYSSSLIMVTFSLIIAVVVLNLARTKHSAPLPWTIKNMLNCLGPWLGLKHFMQEPPVPCNRPEELREQPNASNFDEMTSTDDRQMIAPSSASKQPALYQDWLLLAAALDRVGFLVYCFVFAIMAAVYSI